MIQTDNPLEQRPQIPDPRVLGAVFGAIDDVNQLLPAEHQVEKSLEAPILGPTAELNSMDFVNLIAALEERISADLGMTLSLVGREAGSGTFKTVSTLVTYISQVLAEKARR